MSVWQPQAARVTLFPLIGTGAAPISALDLYRNIIGRDPDNFQNQTIPGMPVPTSAAQGQVNGLTFACQAQPVRIDFTFSPSQQQVPILGNIPAFKDGKVLHDEMVRVIPLIEAAVADKNFNRAACYLQLGVDGGTPAAANEILAKSIPYKIQLTDEEDFVLQINRPRHDADDPSLRLNFLTKWSVQRVQIMSFMASAEGGAAGLVGGPTMNSKTMASIALDNSSTPKRCRLTDSQIRAILSTAFSEFAKQLTAYNLSIEGFNDAGS